MKIQGLDSKPAGGFDMDIQRQKEPCQPEKTNRDISFNNNRGISMEFMQKTVVRSEGS